MSQVDSLAKDFLAQKNIAVVGVSDTRQSGCNLAYRKFMTAGHKVFAVNPHIETFDGNPCYPDLELISCFAERIINSECRTPFPSPS
jgi:uncharacterized protein